MLASEAVGRRVVAIDENDFEETLIGKTGTIVERGKPGILMMIFDEPNDKILHCGHDRHDPKDRCWFVSEDTKVSLATAPVVQEQVDPEIAAIIKCVVAFAGLDADQSRRVCNYINARFYSF